MCCIAEVLNMQQPCLALPQAHPATAASFGRSTTPRTAPSTPSHRCLLRSLHHASHCPKHTQPPLPASVAPPRLHRPVALAHTLAATAQDPAAPAPRQAGPGHRLRARPAVCPRRLCHLDGRRPQPPPQVHTRHAQEAGGHGVRHRWAAAWSRRWPGWRVPRGGLAAAAASWQPWGATLVGGSDGGGGTGSARNARCHRLFQLAADRPLAAPLRNSSLALASLSWAQ